MTLSFSYKTKIATPSSDKYKQTPDNKCNHVHSEMTWYILAAQWSVPQYFILKGSYGPKRV